MAVEVVACSGPQDGPYFRASASGGEGRKRWRVNIGDGILADGTQVGTGVIGAVQAVVAATGVNLGVSFDALAADVVCQDIEARPEGGTNAAGGDNTGGWCIVEARYGVTSTSGGGGTARPVASTAYTEFVTGATGVTLYYEPYTNSITFGAGQSRTGTRAIANGQGAPIEVGTCIARVRAYTSIATAVNVPALATGLLQRVNSNAITLPPLRYAPSGHTYSVAIGCARMLSISVEPISDTLREIIYEMELVGSELQMLPRWKANKNDGTVVDTTTYFVDAYERVAFPTGTEWIV